MNELSKNQLHYLNMHRRHKRIIAVSRVSILLTFLFLWEFSANTGLIDSFIFSSPSRIALCFLEMTGDGSIFRHIGVNIDPEIMLGTLTVGKQQMVEIAKAISHDCKLLVLDEPTAALDPIAEAEIYGKFNEITGDKTAIYISHRLSSCKFCDKIVVFHEGSVIQTGTHQELAADKSGKYFQLWTAQAQYYR